MTRSRLADYGIITVRVTLHLPPQVVEDWRHYAYDTGISPEQLVETYLRSLSIATAESRIVPSEYPATDTSLSHLDQDLRQQVLDTIAARERALGH